MQKKITNFVVESWSLSYPSEEHTFILDTDASDFAIGGEFSQLIDGLEHVICYGSHVLTAEQRKYCTTRKELLAIVRFCHQFLYYLLRRRFMVRTDHNSLVWLLGYKNFKGKLSTWIQKLSQLDMVIVHRPGSQHMNADILSRISDDIELCRNYNSNVIDITQLPCYPCRFCECAHSQWSQFTKDVDYVVLLSSRKIKLSIDIKYYEQNWGVKYTSPELRNLQENYSDLSTVITWLENGIKPNWSRIGTC